MPSKRPLAIHWNVIVVPCELDGEHKILVAGLDHCADDTAAEALSYWQATCPGARRLSMLVAIETALAVLASDGDIDIDDLPF